MNTDSDLIAINIMLKMSDILIQHIKLWEENGTLRERDTLLLNEVRNQFSKFGNRWEYKRHPNAMRNLDEVLVDTTQDVEFEEFGYDLFKTMFQIAILYGTLTHYRKQILGVVLKENINDVFKLFRHYLEMWEKEIDGRIREVL